MRTMLVGVAEMERYLISGRTVSGQRTRARKGIMPGGTTPYGWRRNPKNKGGDGRFVPDEDEREVLQAAAHAYLSITEDDSEANADRRALDGLRGEAEQLGRAPRLQLPPRHQGGSRRRAARVRGGPYRGRTDGADRSMGSAKALSSRCRARVRRTTAA